jgi:hypothetical protein
LQFAPELRSVVASLLPALFNKVPMGFNGRMTKATLAFRELIGFEISSNRLPAQTTLAGDLALRQPVSRLLHREVIAFKTPLAVLLLTLSCACNRRSGRVFLLCGLRSRLYLNSR